MIFTGEKKNKIKRRVVAMVLCICMVVALSGTSGFGLYAAGENMGGSHENGVATASDAEVGNTPADQSNESEATPVGNVAEDITEDPADEMAEENQTEETKEQSTLALNWAVVESGRFDTPAENKYIVLDLGDEGTSFDSATLTIINETNGEETTLAVDTILDTTLLFYASFPDTSFTGKYRVASVQYTSGGVTYEKNLMDDEMAPRFGVNCDIGEEPDLVLGGEDFSEVATVDEVEDSASADPSITDNNSDASNVTDVVDYDSSLGKEVLDLSNDFSGANVIGVDGENSDINLSGVVVSGDESGLTKELNNENMLGTSLNELVFSKSPENIVIVLDPGHGGSDEGAVRTWNGVRYCERDLNQVIANACKEELSKYKNVTVYMTRSTTTEALHGGTGADLQWRCNYAHEMNADLFVSLHCNSSTVDNTRYGAEVYIPNSSLSAQAHNVAKTVGTKIGQKLAALGLSNGTTYTRSSENGSTYDDGSIADYYAVIRHCKEYMIPGMIVEHGYVNSKSDCEKYFSTNDKLKALGVADAQAIAENIGLIEQNRVNNDMKITGWRKSGDTYVYYVDGNVQTGFFVVGGKKYYGRSNGQIVKGWQLIDGVYYLFDSNGAMMISSWVQDGSGNWLWLDGNGHMATGITDAGGTWYLMDGEGHMLKGWQLYGNRWYYMNDSGAMLRSAWIKSGSSWYYMCADGHMAANETINDGGYSYFCGSDGVMATGWRYDGTNWYYAGSSGALYVGCWAKYKGYWYYFEADGKMATGKKNLGGVLYYLYGDGSMGTGWIAEGSNWYYAADSGALSVGCWNKVNKKWYYFEADGKMATGFKKDGDQTYYLEGSGAMISDNWFKVGSDWYYATGSGALLGNNWLESSGKWYYLNADYKMATDSVIIGDKKYYFDTSGAMTRSEAYVAPANGSNTDTSTSSQLYAIMGGTTHTATDFANAYIKEGKTYPTAVMAAGGAANIEAFCKIIIEEASAEGVKAEVVFAQIMHETGYLQFGGSVSPQQYNFCGLGAVNATEKGYDFPDVRTGIRAEVQHLKAYASKDALKNTCVDPRFKYVERGVAPYVQYLGIKENPSGKGWATSERYGEKLMKVINALPSKK
jgi:glucan-binding YG repeat protein/N-acetylmuramoyl-L-alanine amidase